LLITQNLTPFIILAVSPLGQEFTDVKAAAEK
jgi:hypothetical protein